MSRAPSSTSESPGQSATAAQNAANTAASEKAAAQDLAQQAADALAQVQSLKDQALAAKAASDAAAATAASISDPVARNPYVLQAAQQALLSQSLANQAATLTNQANDWQVQAAVHAANALTASNTAATEAAKTATEQAAGDSHAVTPNSQAQASKTDASNSSNTAQTQANQANSNVAAAIAAAQAAQAAAVEAVNQAKAIGAQIDQMLSTLNGLKRSSCGGPGQPSCTSGGSCGGPGQPVCEIDWGSGTLPGDPSADSLITSIGTALQAPFADLLAWTPPSSSGICPTVTFNFFNRSFVMDTHCTMAESIRGLLSSVMTAVWYIAAFFIVLSA